jgi:hypothetical protein
MEAAIFKINRLFLMMLFAFFLENVIKMSTENMSSYNRNITELQQKIN